jgi:hypothetical protein
LASSQYFDFIGTFWELIPAADKERMGELWHGYEQAMSSVYQKFVEVDLNCTVRDLQQYSVERWLSYTFNADNQLNKPAIFTSTRDLSIGLNLTSVFLLKFRINGGVPFTVNVAGATPTSTQISEIVAKINAVAGFAFARSVSENLLIQLTSNTSGPTSQIEILEPASSDATEAVLGLSALALPATYPEFPYAYTLPYQRIVDIPELQDAIRPESSPTVFTSGVDYFVDPSGLLSFKEAPPSVPLWATKTLFDEEVPWNNFGFLMGIYQPNTPLYLSVIQGLWFAFWTGPKPSSVKSALYLLFGLPVAQEVSTVTAVSTTEIETTSPDGIVRLFAVPPALNPIVVVGQALTRFQPLVDGIEIFDKINAPGFVTLEVGRPGVQRFLTESASVGPGDTDETKALTLLEEHTFLPQISVNAFISSGISLSNVRRFLEDIKPLNKTFFFDIIVGKFSDELVPGERLGFDVDINVTPNLDSNETTFQPPADLETYETVDNPGLDLDSNGFVFRDSALIEVYSFAVLIDSFTA